MLQSIKNYYQHFYGAKLGTENICIFAGGRPGIYATLAFLQKDVRVLVEETEYTPYFDMLKNLGRQHTVVPSNPDNAFRPTVKDYEKAGEELDI